MLLGSLSGADRVELNGDVLPWIVIGFAFLSLLIGNPFFDERLVLAGIPLNPVVFGCLSAGLAFLLLRKDDWAIYALGILPTSALLVTAFWSRDIDYGLLKYSGLVISSGLTFLYFVAGIRMVGTEACFRILTWILLTLLLIAFAYKLQFGFFDRQVRFFLNGPIVFGRLMSLGAIAALIGFTGLARIVLATTFVLAVLWTASKGPILGVSIGLVYFTWIKSPPARRPYLLLIGASIVASVILLGSIQSEGYAGRILALLLLFTDPASALSDSGPFGNRVALYGDTFALIAKFPMGVGLGAWSSFVADDYGLYYPHNLFLEVFSESGILLGLIGITPFLLFLAVRHSVFTLPALYFLVVQQVSGDLLDARFILVFSMLAIWAELGGRDGRGRLV